MLDANHRMVGMRSNARRAVVLVSHEYLPFAGGISTYTYQMAMSATSAGVDVEVLAPKYPDASFDESGPVSVIRVLEHHNLSLLTAIKVAADLARRSPGAFLHAADIRAALLLFAVRYLTGRRYGVMIHGSDVGKLSGRTLSVRFARAAYRAIVKSGVQATESSGGLIDCCYLDSIFEFDSSDYFGQVIESA